MKQSLLGSPNFITWVSRSGRRDDEGEMKQDRGEARRGQKRKEGRTGEDGHRRAGENKGRGQQLS